MFFHKTFKPNTALKTLSDGIVANKWLIAVFCIWAASYLAVNYYLTRNDQITVTGSSINVEKNQIATFTLTVSTQDKDKSKAVDDTNKKSNEIIAAIKDFGIPDDDVKTQNMTIYQREDYVPVSAVSGRQTYVKGDWVANIGIEIILRDVTRATDLAGMLSAANIDNLYGPNFSVDSKQLDEAKLLQMAVDDAKEKASAVAKSMGRGLGSAVNVTEGSSYSPNPYSYLKSSSGLGGGSAPDMMPGTTEVQKNVVVTYRLK